ncbi:MAG: OmpA family protein [Phaeodactylibacter sp.]|uniref:OmpA family protein n=1 Tax=Phaeodactylibacter sp. TaxID=1940289 RepID=UPI0032EDAE6A
MKWTILPALFFYGITSGQNLVPNPGFETVKDTIHGFTENNTDFTSKIEAWTTPNTASPDLITPDFYERYIKPAAPHSGKNMAGIQAKAEWAEYLGIALSEKLIPNRTYYASFWIRRAFCINPQMNIDQVMNTKFGILFSPVSIKTATGDMLSGSPQVAVDSLLMVTDQEWMKISGYFTPKEKHKYLYIGQFCEEGQKAEIMGGYYVIDDVLVEAVTGYGTFDKNKPLPVGSIIPLSQINFVTGTTELSDEESYTLLSDFAAYLKQNPSVKIRINGHTDSVGSARSNLQLSKTRAKFIAGHLIAYGIDKSRITSKGFGAEQPVADNQTPTGRAKNRRVEFEIMR